MIYVLKANLDYPKDCYYLEKFETKEKALQCVEEGCFYLNNYVFIEGKELKLILTEENNENN